MAEKRAIAKHKGGGGRRGEEDSHLLLFYAQGGGKWVAKAGEGGRHRIARPSPDQDENGSFLARSLVFFGVGSAVVLEGNRTVLCPFSQNYTLHEPDTRSDWWIPLRLRVVPRRRVKVKHIAHVISDAHHSVNGKSHARYPPLILSGALSALRHRHSPTDPYHHPPCLPKYSAVRTLNL